MLIIADEAPGIEADIWDAIEGIRAGGNVHVLELGNPVIPSGHFYDSFTRNRSIYRTISISAFDTPNLQHVDGRPLTAEELMAMSVQELAYCPFPSLITREWVAERFRIWGPKHPKYVARVLGEFTSDDPPAYFPFPGLSGPGACPPNGTTRSPATWLGHPSGNRCCWCRRRPTTVLTARIGGMILGQRFWSEADPRGAVLAELSHIRAGRYRLPLGTTVADTVRRQVCNHGPTLLPDRTDPNVWQKANADLHRSLLDLGGACSRAERVPLALGELR